MRKFLGIILTMILLIGAATLLGACSTAAGSGGNGSGDGYAMGPQTHSLLGVTTF